MSTDTRKVEFDFPAGSTAWFVCRAKGIVADVDLRLKLTRSSDAQLSSEGRAKAARRFKRDHGLHPCTRVDVEYMGVEGPDGTGYLARLEVSHG